MFRGVLTGPGLPDDSVIAAALSALAASPEDRQRRIVTLLTVAEMLLARASSDVATSEARHELSAIAAMIGAIADDVALGD